MSENNIITAMPREPEQANRPVAVTPLEMLDRALTLGAAPETLEKLLALQERWEANQARRAFDEAMAAAKAEIPIIRKNRVVDFTSQKGRTHYKHEDLAEIAETVNPILSRHGLSYRFRTSAEPNQPIVVTCIVTHRMGYFEETTLSGPRDESGNKNPIQAVGSTLTYLQRMTLKAALGLAAAEDDDGAASGAAKQSETISEDQELQLRDLITESGADLSRFLQYAGIERLPDMKASQFSSAVAMLKKRMEKANG